MEDFATIIEPFCVYDTDFSRVIVGVLHGLG
jgi:hypothetical protein